MGIARNLGAIRFLASSHSSALNHAFGPGKGTLLPSLSPPALNGHWLGHPSCTVRSGNGAVLRVEHLVLTRGGEDCETGRKSPHNLWKMRVIAVRGPVVALQLLKYGG